MLINHKKIAIAITSLVLTLPTAIFAADSEAVAPSSLGSHIETRQEYCPPVESLRQNKDNSWSASNGWKNNTPSFVKSVNEFLGAQWIGINVGEVICVYGKTGRNEFPITLQRPYLVESPEGSHWTEVNGHKDCKSTDIYQCPFNVRTTVRSKSIYEDLNFHKGKPVQESN